MDMEIREARLLGEQLARNLKHDLGVDVLPILHDESLTRAQRRSKVVYALLEAAVNRADEGPHRAEWAAPAGVDENAFLASVAAAEVEVEPNIVISEKEAKRLRDLQGQAVKDYIYNLSERMEQMAKASGPEDLALMILTGGLISVGAPMAVGTVGALRAGQAVLAAVRIGVLGIGMKTAVGTVIIVLAGLLMWLLFENPKKLLGMVLNNTDGNLVVANWRAGVDGGDNSDLWMQHGNMQKFMQDYQGGDLTKKIQLNARVVFGPGDPDNCVYGGIYFADKNAGFRGAEGLMIFQANNLALRFAHMFAVPYTKDNGTNMTMVSGSPNKETLYRQLYDNRGVRVNVTSGGYNMTSTVNDPRGGVVGCIASITKT